MSFMWRVFYRVGFTPWETLDDLTAAQLRQLLAEEDGAEPPYGKALDIGCGSGQHSVELAERGWEVTGIDLVPLAIRRAEARAAKAGQQIRFVSGDVTRMSEQVGDGYRLLFDLGCFHSLDDRARADYAREASAVAAEGAKLLMFAFAAGARRPLPRGVDRPDLEALFADWKLLDTAPAVLPERLAARASANWFRLQHA